MIRNHDDQVGFMPGMQGFLNIEKPINVIHHINKEKSHMIISTHTEKDTEINTNQYPFLIKKLYNLAIIGNFSTLDKGHL